MVTDGGKSETCHETASAVCRRMEYVALHNDFKQGGKERHKKKEYKSYQQDTNARIIIFIPIYHSYIQRFWLTLFRKWN